MKKPKYERCLITSITPFKWPKTLYYVNVLTSATANMATGTGIASTITMNKAQLDEAKQMHGLRTLKALLGAPVICKVEYNTSNVLGESTFHKNTF